MNRLARLWALCATALLLMSMFFQGGIGLAQDDTQATISALQTEAAGLKTMVALQTEVADLSTQVGQQGTTEPSGTMTPTPTVTPTPPPAGTVLYEANVENGGFDEWSNSSWSVLDGSLINTGDDRPSYVTAPVDLGLAANYVIEAEIEIVQRGTCESCYFGLVVRAGYFAGFRPGTAVAVIQSDARLAQSFASKPFQTPDEGSLETYRVEADGNRISLSLGDTVAAAARNDHFVYGGGGIVGLWTDGVDIRVYSFKVIAL